MKYSQATDNALHVMLYLIMADPEKPVGAQMLSEKLNVSRTYLSKMMAQLVKAELIQSVSGLNGGYRLRKPGKDISFLEVIQAIEGTGSLYECKLNHGSGCLIQQAVIEAEQQMEDYLKHKKIADLLKSAKTD